MTYSRLLPGKPCIVIADVSGKGVPAALFMTMAKTHIKNYAMLDMPLEELAFRVNNRLCEDNPEEMFVTAFIGMLDTEQGILTFVNAGHNHPYVSSEQGPFRQAACHSDFVLCRPVGGYEVQREQKLELGKQGTIFSLYRRG
ncbi:MAG: PP2C family protein-serine/threonine phosphatase [Enterocloster sp.]